VQAACSAHSTLAAVLPALYTGSCHRASCCKTTTPPPHTCTSFRASQPNPTRPSRAPLTAAVGGMNPLLRKCSCPARTAAPVHSVAAAPRKPGTQALRGCMPTGGQPPLGSAALPAHDCAGCRSSQQLTHLGLAPPDGRLTQAGTAHGTCLPSAHTCTL
jgi:hypothetical protein